MGTQITPSAIIGGGGGNVTVDAAGSIHITAVGGQPVTSTSNDFRITSGPIEMPGMAAPALSNAGEGRIYYDTSTNKWKVSENTGAYVSMISGGATVASTSDILKGDGAGNAVALGSGTGISTWLVTPNETNLKAAQSGLAWLDTAQTFTGNQTISSASFGLSGNISSAAWTTNGIRYKNVAATLTDTSSSGTVAAAYTDVWGGNTIAASSATTFTDYYGSYFKIPVVGTNVTFTNAWGIGTDSLKVGTSNPLTISTSGVLTATSPVFVTPALGTPASGVVTNLTGTASININGTVGATTRATGAFTTINANSTATLTGVSNTGSVVSTGLIQSNSNIWINNNTGLGLAFGTSGDIALNRNAAGVLEVNNGTAGTFADLKLRYLTSTAASAASQSVLTLSGAPYAAGTATTNFPLFYLNDSTATASTTLSANGTYFGVNGHGSADLLNLMVDGSRMLKVASDGSLTTNNDIYFKNSGGSNVSGAIHGEYMSLQAYGGAILFVTGAGGGTERARFSNAGVLQFGNNTNDTGIARNAAGIVEVNNGTAGTFADLKLRYLSSSAAGAASQSIISLTGAPYAAGTATTNFPLLYLNDSTATASTTLSTSGTYLGVNGHGSADLMKLMVDGVSKFKVDSTGAILPYYGVDWNGSGPLLTDGTFYLKNTILGWWNGSNRLSLDSGVGRESAGLVGVTNGTSGTFRDAILRTLKFDNTTNSGAQVFHDLTNGFTLQSAAGTATWNDSSTANSGTVANRYLFGIAAPTLTATGTSVTDTVASTLYIGGAPTASTNTTIGTAYALNVAAGNTLLGGTLSVTGASTLTGGLKGTATNDNATAGNVGEYVSSSVVQGSAVALTTATPKTVTSISLTAGDWDVTAIGALTGASTGTEFDVAIGTTTNSLTGTVLGDTRCQTPTVSLTGADASLMIPAVRVSINATTTYYLIVQETFTVGSPSAYGRISARRVR